MASVSGWMGDGLQGTPSGCEGIYDNPVINFGEPFGHAHLDDINYLLQNCTCSIYGAKTSFNVSSLSTCHEIVFVYYRLYPDIDGRTYRIQLRTEKDGNEVNYMDDEFVWDDAWEYYHGCYFLGWTPCFMWPGGSDYNPNYVEITDNGSDYEAFVELWDTVTETKVASWSQTFTITNLTHTVMSGTIQNYAGENVKGDIRIRSEYTLPAGACADGIGRTGEVYQERADDDDYNYNINVDGMEGLVRITPYKSGYQLREVEFSGITAKNLNINNDFTGVINYLRSTVIGIVIDSDANPIENANVWCEKTGYKFGAKSNSDGKYALPIHADGIYIPKAIKNNFDVKLGSNIGQTGYHPISPTIRNFTLTRKSDPTGDYAHINSLCVDDQSVVILDDPVTSSTLIKPSNVGVTIVKVKTRKWGTGAAQSTSSTGTSNGGIGYGSGGRDYDGDTGDAESWE